MNRIELFHQSLLALSRSSLADDVSRIDAFRRITEGAARLLGVSRAAIWLRNRERTFLVLADRYDDDSGLHEAGAALDMHRHDALVQRLDRVRVLTVADTALDPQIAAVYDDDEASVRAVLGAPIRRGTELIGGLALEQVDRTRHWREDEQQVAAALADLVSLALRKLEQDETERNLRRALKELERQQEAMDRHAIVSTCEPNGRIVYVNDKFCEVSGYTREELIGQNHNIINSGHHPPEFFRDMWRTVAAGRIWQGEIRNRRKDGGYYWVESTIVPMLDDTGRVERYTAIRTDITALMEAEEVLRRSNIRLDSKVRQKVAELQQVQQQLLQSEKMASIGQLAAGVAHEINNPVGYINSNLGSLTAYLDDLFGLLDLYHDAAAALAADHPLRRRIERREAEIDFAFLRADAGDLVNESREGVERVKRIISDLKDFSRTGDTTWELTDLHRTLDATLNIVHNELKYKAEVTRAYGELPPVECVPSQLGQVFMNLLVNAAHAIDGRGSIDVRTGQEGEWVWVAVRDSGRGIEPQHLPRLFDPFFTTKPVGQGTGLGLSVSYGIIEKHGGRIEVESTPGAGSCFTVYLPLRQSPREPSHAVAEPRA